MVSIPRPHGHTHDDTGEHELAVAFGVLQRIDPRMLVIVGEDGHVTMESTLDADTTARVLSDMAEKVRRNGFHRCAHHHI